MTVFVAALAGTIRKILKKYGLDQRAEFLVDDALFSDSSKARIRAINLLARDYGSRGIPLIKDIKNTLPPTDEVFRSFCASVIHDIHKKESLSNVALA
ncbi:MAG: hypothetical protein ACREAW_10860 [Nitrososphaera sp.]